MSDDDKDDKGADEKLLTRAYVDLLSGAVSEVGDRLTRAVGLALGPVDLVLWSADKVRAWVSSDLPKRLRERGAVESEIVSPPPQILGGVLAGLQTAGPVDELREMFSNLLATAMQASSAHDAHPAHIEVLRQLSAEDARILASLRGRNSAIAVIAPDELGDVELTNARVSGWWHQVGQEAGVGREAGVSEAVSNLERLGIISLRDDAVSVGPATGQSGHAGRVGIRYAWYLTPFGSSFVRACMEGWDPHRI